MGVEELARGSEDMIGVDGVHLLRYLILGKLAAKIHLLARQIGHAAHGGFERQQHAALQIVLGALEFLIARRARFERPELFRDEVHHISRAGRRSTSVNAETTGVAIGAETGKDRVGQAALFAHVLKQA